MPSKTFVYLVKEESLWGNIIGIASCEEKALKASNRFLDLKVIDGDKRKRIFFSLNDSPADREEGQYYLGSFVLPTEDEFDAEMGFFAGVYIHIYKVPVDTIYTGKAKWSNFFFG